MLLFSTYDTEKTEDVSLDGAKTDVCDWRVSKVHQAAVRD